MSELKVNKVTPRSGTTVTLGDSGDTITIPSGAMKNIIINGDMSIAQRGTTATGIGNGDLGYHTVDRWKFIEDGSPTYEFTMSQDTDVPSGQGFAKSLKLDITTEQVSLLSTEVLIIEQSIEGQNLQYLKKGTANAESLTISFWVKSNKTGSFALGFRDVDNSRRNNNLITINSSNTWEKKTLTIDGDTSGALDNDNGASLIIQFWLDSGSNYNSGTQQSGWVSNTNSDINAGNTFTFADSTSNYINITGVQLEAGTTASDFEFLPVDVNLGRCLRYYEKITAEASSQMFGAGFNYNTTNGVTLVNCSKKRTAVSVAFSGTVAEFGLYSSSGSRITATAIAASQGSSISFQTTVTVASGLTAGNGTTFIANASTNPYIEISAEL
jgi:hypothetical protein